jgi:hypothetical protein
MNVSISLHARTYVPTIASNASSIVPLGFPMLTNISKECSQKTFAAVITLRPAVRRQPTALALAFALALALALVLKCVLAVEVDCECWPAARAAVAAALFFITARLAELIGCDRVG